MTLSKKQKLELTWIGKENLPKPEPCVLLTNWIRTSFAAGHATELLYSSPKLS
jgi:hypothetical protein